MSQEKNMKTSNLYVYNTNQKVDEYKMTVDAQELNKYLENILNSNVIYIYPYLKEISDMEVIDFTGISAFVDNCIDNIDNNNNNIYNLSNMSAAINGYLTLFTYTHTFTYESYRLADVARKMITSSITPENLNQYTIPEGKVIARNTKVVSFSNFAIGNRLSEKPKEKVYQ